MAEIQIQGLEKKIDELIKRTKNLSAENIKKIKGRIKKKSLFVITSE